MPAPLSSHPPNDLETCMFPSMAWNGYKPPTTRFFFPLFFATRYGGLKPQADVAFVKKTGP